MTSKKPLIAIVDDDEPVCRSLVRLIRASGIAVESYASGADFIKQIESFPSLPVDCVVLDAQMPGMTGLELQSYLRRTHKDIPVVFITAHEDVAVREQALAAGAIAFLYKPCNDSLIFQALDIALRRGRADEPAGLPEGNI